MHVFYLLRGWGTGSVSCPGDVWAGAESHQRQIHFCSAQLMLPQSGTPAAWLLNPADCTNREPWITSEFIWSRAGVYLCVFLRTFDLLADIHSLEDTSRQQYVLACRCGRVAFSCKSPSQEMKKFAVNWNIYAKVFVLSQQLITNEKTISVSKASGLSFDGCAVCTCETQAFSFH